MLCKALITTALVVTIAGCATPPPIEFTPDSTPEANERINAELRGVSVRTAKEDEQVGEGVNWYQTENMVGHQFVVTSTGTGIPITKQWESALGASLNESLIFTDNPSKRVSLFVDVKQVEWSGMVTVAFDVLANYRLMDRATGDNLYEQDIHSKGSAATSEAFVGAVRSRIALVRAIKANIQTFLNSLNEQVPQINKGAMEKQTVQPD